MDLPLPLPRSARARGCLLGGAVGDALGAPIEFMSIAEVRGRFGEAGALEFSPASGRVGAITDDTQMTLFTAEGLIRSAQRSRERGICHPPSVIHHALLRWLHTQGERSPALREPDGWLIEQRELHSRRAPGTTCLSALRAAQKFGDLARNDSKGCGAIMRVAPIGIVIEENSIYELASESAQSTHGHPTSTTASGFFAVTIGALMRGHSLIEAITRARARLRGEDAANETVDAVTAALRAADSDLASSPETLETLGKGWIAEEALAIALFCALRARDFEHGVRLAVNHGGDSDSTGSLTGQLLGALLGESAIPERWLAALELRDVIAVVADDLVAISEGAQPGDERTYPAW